MFKPNATDFESEVVSADFAENPNPLEGTGVLEGCPKPNSLEGTGCPKPEEGLALAPFVLAPAAPKLNPVEAVLESEFAPKEGVEADGVPN